MSLNKKYDRAMIIKTLEHYSMNHLANEFRNATDPSSGNRGWINRREMQGLLEVAKKQGPSGSGGSGLARIERNALLLIAKYEKVGPLAEKYIEYEADRWKNAKKMSAAFVVTFSHGGRIPLKTKKDAKGNFMKATCRSLYESVVTVTGPKSGTFRGSIFPNSMWWKGHLKDGSNPIHIGFHKGGEAEKQQSNQLIVKTDGIRAALLVNARSPVPVTSLRKQKKTSSGVNIHNGDSAWNRGSTSCPTIHPDDWERFVKIFLDSYPSIVDWHTIGPNTGKKVGMVVVKR